MPEIPLNNSESKELQDNCEIVVCIPVAGHQEGANIYRTLESYTNQTLPPENFEINLYVNKPIQDPEGNPIAWDQTFEEIERFKSDFPDIQVVVETEEFGPGEFTIGKVRHNQAKKVLQRSVERDNAEREIILVTNDADNKGVSPAYLHNFLTKFSENPKKSAFVGQIDWNPEEYVEHPLVHVSTRLFQYLGIQSRSNWVDSSGANFAIKGSVYAELKGHRIDLGKGEDSDLGDRLKTLKGSKSIGFAGNRVSLVYTSARRAIDTVLKGKAPIEQWDDEFGAFDDEVRKLPQAETSNVNFDNPEDVKNFLIQVEILINRTIQKVLKVNEPWGMTANHDNFRRALNWLGIDQYDIINDRSIHIKSADTLIKNLKAYQTQGPLIQAAKSGDEKAADTLSAERKKDKRAEIRAAMSQIQFNVNFEDQNPVTVDEVLESTETLVSDKYIISLQEEHVLSRNFKGEPQVVIGIQRDTKKIIVAKKRDTIHESWLKTETGANGEDNAEQVMLGEDLIGAPLEKVEIKDVGEFFIYEKAKSDLFAVLENEVEISLSQAIKLVMQLLENLRVLQSKHILHADISPLNIVINDYGDAGLIDLQTSPMKDNLGQFHKPYGGGVREIFPPELINLENPLNPSVDTYSLLSILYRLIKNRYPHQVDSIAKLNLDEKQLNIIYSALHREEEVDYSDIPPGLAKIMKKGLSPDQNDRYESAAELFNDLGKFLITLND
jgi:hypothetical protein